MYITACSKIKSLINVNVIEMNKNYIFTKEKKYRYFFICEKYFDCVIFTTLFGIRLHCYPNRCKCPLCLNAYKFFSFFFSEENPQVCVVIFLIRR